MRRAITRNMHASLHGMAQLTLFTELDASDLVRLRERLQRDFALTYTDIIVYAVARALKQHPRMNASLDGEQVRLHRGIHIGLAVALDDGLIVPSFAMPIASHWRTSRPKRGRSPTAPARGSS